MTIQTNMDYTDHEPEAGNRGVVRVNINETSVNPGVTRVTAAEITQADRVGDILSTAKNNFGSPETRLNPNSVVTLPNGMQTSLAAAIQLGYVRETAPGQYQEVLSSQSEREYYELGQRLGTEILEQRQADAESGPVPFHPQVEQALAPFVENVPGHVQDATISALVNGDYSALPKLAEQAGMDAHAFTQHASLAAEAFADQAARYLDRMGVDGEDFAAWAQQVKPNEYREAVLKHIYGRSPSAYRALAQEFLSSMAPDGQALQQAGIKVYRNERGEEMVRVGGQLMSIAAAVKAGFL
jgi:hypothetical protein